MSQLNRRNALALVVAGLPAMAVPAVAIAAVAPDPIFAAIDAHKRALATFHAYCDGHESDDDEAGRLSDIYCDAARDMLRTVPTTLAGAVTGALSPWLMKYDRYFLAALQRLRDAAEEASD